MLDKEQIKKELMDKSNEILIKYNETYKVEDVSIMNASSEIIFLSSLKVYNEDLTSKIIKDLENSLKGYGNLSIRDRKVVPCCSLPYTQISFNISIPR